MKRRTPRTERPAAWATIDRLHNRHPQRSRERSKPHPMLHAARELGRERDRVSYQETGNPLFVWQAYKFQRLMSSEVPEWVFLYLDNVAESLLSFTDKDRCDASFVAKALDLDTRQGERSAFKGFDQDMAFKLGPAVLRAIADGSQETYAIEAVAKERGVSESTVRRAYKGFMDIYAQLQTQRNAFSDSLKVYDSDD